MRVELVEEKLAEGEEERFVVHERENELFLPLVVHLAIDLRGEVCDEEALFGRKRSLRVRGYEDVCLGRPRPADHAVDGPLLALFFVRLQDEVFHDCVDEARHVRDVRSVLLDRPAQSPESGLQLPRRLVSLLNLVRVLFVSVPQCPHEELTKLCSVQ